MISTSEASKLIAQATRVIDTESVFYEQSVGRVLRQSVNAERDQPPFDRVTMDGIALDFEALEYGTRSFTMQGRQHAGEAAQSLNSPDNCIEIMTGAVLPNGVSCVIPVERITIDGDTATLEDGYVVERGQFVHPRGSDHRQGYEALVSGGLITPMDVAIIASCGLEQVTVSRQPSIRVISTGNELIRPGQEIEAHQVRMSNGPSVIAMLKQHGYTDCAHDHLVDDPEILKERLSRHLVETDVLILSGGVSMGKADFVPQVLIDLGVKVVFHKISQRPGLPMWFGIAPDNQLVFALPGNPVSTLVCCRQYVLPALRQASGRCAAAGEFASLAEKVIFKPELTNFLPVKTNSTAAGVIVATPVKTNTSGDFTALSSTDGYAELARDTTEFERGLALPLHRWFVA